MNKLAKIMSFLLPPATILSLLLLTDLFSPLSSYFKINQRFFKIKFHRKNNLGVEMGWWWRKRNKKRTLEEERTLERGAQLLEDLIEFGHGKSNPIKFFSADEIRKATNNFSESNLVSGLDYYYSEWYSGKNENHPMILIKKCFRWWTSLKVDLFCRDIAVSSMVSGHKNFLKLVGCCFESKYPVLVYDGAKTHYKLDISEQPWKRRMKIAEDIATAFAYLHTAFPRPFIYRCMFLENILLGEDGVAKLTDFTYCVSIPEGETFVEVDRATERLYRFLDDNYISSDVVSEKTDVFAFGMFMGLRFLLGNEDFLELYLEDEEESEGGGSDTDYISMMKRRTQTLLSRLKEDRQMDEIADPKMIEKMGQISKQELCQMEAFRMLSLRCIGPSEEVPTMVEVAKELKKIQTFLYNDFSPLSGETIFDSPQDISSPVLVSNQTLNTKALLTSIAFQVFHEMFQWVMLSWFRFFRKNRRMC